MHVLFHQEQYDPWSFLIPLTYDLWGLTLGTAFVVALVITVLDKLSPYGHYGKYIGIVRLASVL